MNKKRKRILTVLLSTILLFAHLLFACIFMSNDSGNHFSHDNAMLLSATIFVHVMWYFMFIIGSGNKISDNG